MFCGISCAFNGVAYLSEQIKSFLARACVDYQISVSVDHSNDGTEGFLAEWALREPRLTLLPFGERFGGATPNLFEYGYSEKQPQNVGFRVQSLAEAVTII